MSEDSFKSASEGFTRQDAIKFLLQRGELPTQDKVAELMSAGVNIGEGFKPATEIAEPKTVEIIKRKTENFEPKATVINNFHYSPGRIDVQDFVTYFRNRYSVLKNYILARPDCQDATSINKLNLRGAREKSTVIVMIREVQKLNTGTFKMEAEDLTGTISAIISAKKPEIAQKATMLANDEVIGLVGSGSGKTFFVDDIIWPDVPIIPRKQAPDEVYVAFSGDIHAGSNTFLPDKLQKFVDWLNGKSDDAKLRELAEKTKYVIVPGDIVDGIGIYPDQEKELIYSDIYKQYDLAAEYIKQIPSDKIVIICGGNHDSLRMEEPQPALYKDQAAPLYDLPNVINVSNPSLINIHAVGDFPGFKMLLYHGFSFDYFIDKIEGIRIGGGYERPDLIQEYLLKRRHLAPDHKSVPRLPTKEDYLIINNIPDIFVTGHIHKPMISQYKGIITVAAGCWQRNTSFQEKVGIKAEPSKVPLVNLKTGRASMLDFSNGN